MESRRDQQRGDALMKKIIQILFCCFSILLFSAGLQMPGYAEESEIHGELIEQPAPAPKKKETNHKKTTRHLMQTGEKTGSSTMFSFIGILLAGTAIFLFFKRRGGENDE